LEPRGPQLPPAEARKRAPQAASENPACPAAMLQTKKIPAACCRLPEPVI